MTRNRVKEIRTANGVTVRQLAERVDVSHSTISLIERFERGLSVSMAEKIANALGVTATNVLGLDTTSSEPEGLFEDAAPYEMTATTPIMVRTSLCDNVAPFEVRSNALDELGYLPGDIVFVDVSQKAVDGLENGQCVVLQIYSGLTATTVMRQFIAPALLITNSRTKNELPLRLIDDVAIKGVIVGMYRGRH